MRKIIAYLLIVFNIVLGTFIGLKHAILHSELKKDLDFNSGREYIIKFNSGTIKENANFVDKRLKKNKITGHKIDVIDDNTLKVSLSFDNNEKYSQITKLITNNAKHEICSIVYDEESGEEICTEQWKNSEARIEIRENIDILVIPIPKETKEKIEEIHKDILSHSENFLIKGYQTKPRLAWWLDRKNEEHYTDNKKKIENKIIYEFKLNEFFYDEKKNSFVITFGEIKDSEKRSQTYEKLVYYMNLWNTKETLNCEINNNKEEKKINSFLNYNDSLPKYFFYILCILTTIILIAIYRLRSLTIITTTFLNSVLLLIIFVVAKQTFNFSAIVGFNISILLSLMINFIYQNYLSKNIYLDKKNIFFKTKKETNLIFNYLSIIILTTGFFLFFNNNLGIKNIGFILIIHAIFIFPTKLLVNLLTKILINSFYLQNHNNLLINIKNQNNIINTKKINIINLIIFAVFLIGELVITNFIFPINDIAQAKIFYYYLDIKGIIYFLAIILMIIFSSLFLKYKYKFSYIISIIIISLMSTITTIFYQLFQKNAVFMALNIMIIIFNFIMCLFIAHNKEVNNNNYLTTINLINIFIIISFMLLSVVLKQFYTYFIVLIINCITNSLTLKLFIPFTNFFEKKISNIYNKFLESKRNKQKEINEPKETIFPGIND